MMTKKLKLLHTHNSGKYVNREIKINVPQRNYVYAHILPFY